MLQQGSGTVTTMDVFENTQELIVQMLGNSNKSLSCGNEYLNLQLGYGLLEISEGVMRSLSSGRCLCCNQDFARRVFDRGRLLELIMRSTKFCLDTLDPCMIVLKGSKMIVEYNGNVYLLLQNGGSLETCKLCGETLQQVHILCTILRLHIIKEHKSGHAQEPPYQLLVGDISPIPMKETLQGFKKMETPSPVTVRLLVWKLIILWEYNYLVFSSQLDFIVFSLGLWSMGIGSGYVLIILKFQLGIPSSMSCGSNKWCSGRKELLLRVVGVYAQQKETVLKCYLIMIQLCISIKSNGVGHGTVLNKDICNEGLNKWHREIVCMYSWQSDNNVEVDEHYQMLGTQLKVILSDCGHLIVWHEGWITSGWEVSIRELYNSMVAGSVGFRCNQMWQVTFKPLRRFSTHSTISAPTAAKSHFNKIILNKFDPELNNSHHFREIGRRKEMSITFSLKSFVKHSLTGLFPTRYREEYRNLGLEPSILTGEQSHHDIRIIFGPIHGCVVGTTVCGVDDESSSISAGSPMGNRQQCPFLLFIHTSSVCTAKSGSYCIHVTLTLVLVALQRDLAGCNINGDLKLWDHNLVTKVYKQLNTNKEEVSFPRKKWQVRVFVLVAKAELLLRLQIHVSYREEIMKVQIHASTKSGKECLTLKGADTVTHNASHEVEKGDDCCAQEVISTVSCIRRVHFLPSILEDKDDLKEWVFVMSQWEVPNVVKGSRGELAYSIRPWVLSVVLVVVRPCYIRIEMYALMAYQVMK